MLRYLYDFAHSRKILDDLAFTPKAIRWVIPLDQQGRLVGTGVIETEGGTRRGKQFSAPRSGGAKAKGAAGVADFLADGITAVFGQDTDPEKRLTSKQRRIRDANNAKKFEHFWSQIRDAFRETKHPGVGAILSFHEQAKGLPSFLRYGKRTDSDDRGEEPRWWGRTQSGEEVRLGPDQFTFQVEGDLPLLDGNTVRPFWAKVYAQQAAHEDSESDVGFCLVTGADNVSLSQTHIPKIKGVPGTQSFGAAVVSFDKPAFTSYNFEQSLNAPVSTAAVAAYTNALNWMLAHDDHSIKIGNTALCFWAKESTTESSFVAHMLRTPDPKSVAELIKAPWAGVDRPGARLDQFYSVSLSGNAGRVVVRRWMQATVEQARKNLAQWFCDLELVEMSSPKQAQKKKKRAIDFAAPLEGPDERVSPLALFRLACSTVRDAKDLQTEVIEQLYRAALEGSSPSLRLISPILYRLKADLHKYGPKTLANSSRFALMKLVLNRNRKEGDPMIKSKVAETDDPAYNCGRLLAIFDDLQMAAWEYRLEGAGVVERYYGSASSAPNSAFGILWRLHQHHLRKLARQGDRGRAAAEAIKRRIGEIAVLFSQRKPGLSPEFPRTFTLVEQGRFALGFYQQKAESHAARLAHAQKDK